MSFSSSLYSFFPLFIEKSFIFVYVVLLHLICLISTFERNGYNNKIKIKIRICQSLSFPEKPHQPTAFQNHTEVDCIFYSISYPLPFLLVPVVSSTTKQIRKRKSKGIQHTQFYLYCDHARLYRLDK